MPATLHKIPTLISDPRAELPGTTLRVANSGLVTITATFEVATSNNTANLALLGRWAHPRYPWALQEGDAVVTEGEGGLTQYAITFQGSQSAQEWNGTDPDVQEQEPPTYTLGQATESDPLATNPEYDSLTALDKLEVYREYEASDGLSYPAAYIGWPEKKQQLFDKLAGAQTSWRSPRRTWTVTYNTTKPVSTAIARRQGTICKPWGPAPELPEGANWLLDQITESRTGGSQSINLVWLASGPGGWDADHYSFTRGQS